MNKENYIDLDKGMYIGEVEDQDFFIKWKDLSGNLAVTGNTRIGKTRLMAAMIRQCILKGDTVIIIDPKSSADNEIASWINDFAIEAKREEDILYINPMNLKDSIAFNPLYGLSNEEIASNISTKLDARDDCYIVMAYTVTFAIAIGLEFIDKYKIENIDRLPLRKFITFDDINRLSTKENLSYLLDTVNNLEISESSENKEKNSFKILKTEAIRSLSEQIEKDDSYFSKVSVNFNNSMKKLSSGDIGNILCSEKRNPLLNKIEKENPIIILQPFPLKYKTSAELLVRSFIDTLVLFYKRVQQNNSEIKDVFLFVDEAGAILFPGIEYLFNTSGGLGLRTISFSQPYEDYGFSLARELNKIIQDNTRINIYMNFSELYLNRENETGYMGSKLDMRISTADEELIKRIESLKKREFILTNNGNKYKGISPYQEDPKYILNTEDLYSRELNNIYLSFSEVVTSKRLRDLVKFGLREVIKYKFDIDKSVNIQSATDSEYLRTQFSNSFEMFTRINLKDHTLNVFSTAINKLKNTSDKEYIKEMTLSLVATLFHDFGKSRLLRESQIGNESGKAYRKHDEVSKIYLEEDVSPRFRDLHETIETISFLVENHHPSNNRMKRNNKISFIINADYEARKTELRILQYPNTSTSYRENFNHYLDEKRESIVSKKEERSKEKEKREKELKVIHKSNKIYIYEKDIIIEIINKNAISRISFNYLTIDGFIYNTVHLHLENGNTVPIKNVSQEIIDYFLNE